MSTKWKALIMGVVFIVLIALMLFGTKGDFELGERLPAFSLNSLDGSVFSFPDDKHIVILYFWATFCDTCREEAEDMNIVYNTFKDKGVVIYAINIEPGNRDGIMEFVKRYGWEFPVLLDPDNKVGKSFRITGVPETLIAGKDGRLAIPRIIGHANWASPSFRKSIEELINQDKK